MWKEWEHIEKGLVQRLRALNAFINDIYNDHKILKNKVVPEELLKTSKNYRVICEGMKSVHGVWAHVCGSDIIRDSDGSVYVLDDNLRFLRGFLHAGKKEYL